MTAPSSNGPAVAPIVVALAEKGIRVRSLTLRAPTLDDVFLTLTGTHFQEETSNGD